ncbi:CHASE domain-containing protein [Massilia sp. W12]|uniref:CHASE domain-containing protein n=1 Tax=Massilia sp. W12 TaxID=3126507 RepID=UPI0030CFE1CB
MSGRASVLMLRLFSRRNLPAWLIFALALLVTQGIAWSVAQEAEQNAARQFELHAQEVISKLSARMHQHEQILTGGAALFEADKENLERHEWHDYIARLELGQHLPGILGVGFARYVPGSGIAAFQAKVQAEGFPDFQVRPPGVRAAYAPIEFLEPMSGRNLAAFGYDLYSEPVRRRALELATDSGETTITGKVRLVQENQGKVQAGFLMCIPVYKKKPAPHNPEQRRAALTGFVYSPYRMEDMMAGTFNQELNLLDLRIYDGAQDAPEALMFDSAHFHAPEQHLSAPHALKRTMRHFGHAWTLHLQSRPAFAQSTHSQMPSFIRITGVSIGMLTFMLISSLVFQQQRAQELAQQMTADIRASEALLRASEERFELAVKGSSDGIWDWSIASNTLYYSPRLHAMLGSSPQDLEQGYAFFASRVHPEDLPKVEAAINAHLEENTPYNLEFRMRAAPNGEYQWFNARGIAARDAQGKAVRMAGSLTDISERLRVEKMKSEFISTINHELRTPLTAINGVLGLMAGNAVAPLPDKLRSMVEVAQRNCQRLSSLVNDLLDLEKLMAGKFSFDLQCQELAPLIQQALESTDSYGAQYQVRFTFTTTAHAAYAEVDAQRLHQVLLNLLSNAAKFSPPGSTVEVRLQPGAPAHWRIEVCDQGSGIAPEFQQRIFEKFSQADASATRQRGGTGLGLAITRELVQGMRGHIGFHSSPNQGSVFYFELPASQPAGAAQMESGKSQEMDA